MIPTERPHLHVAAISHPGMSGKNNEDRYGVSAYRLDRDTSRPSVLAIVADGIGGHRAGEVAAELAVETISQMVSDSDGSQPVKTLQNALIRASWAIHEAAETDPARKGMGSTCAIAWVIGERLYTASVGDSRIYLIRDNTIRQLTTDHTWIQEAIESGALSPEQAHDHPNAHVIRRYLGSRQPVVPDLRLRLQPGESDARAEANQGTLLSPGDLLLLCSDGLTDLVENDEILTALKAKDPEEALKDLVALANQRGGHDNITVVTLDVPGEIPQALPASAPGLFARFKSTCVVIGALILVGAALGGGLIWYLNNAEFIQSSTATPTSELQATLFPTFTDVGTAPAIAPLPSLPVTIQATGEIVIPQPQASLTPWPTNTLPASSTLPVRPTQSP